MGLLVLIPQATANDPFSVWLNGVRLEALSRGIKRTVIDNALNNVQPIRLVLKRDRSQSEFKLNLSKYSSRVVTKNNINLGRTKAKLHSRLLKKVSQKFGVQPRFIMAIWGIETRFGLVQANTPLIPAVATLAFDKRRSKYFRNQLFAVLKMLDQSYIEVESLYGSWAGAMGQPQFMPSSYLAYAKDFDGDGRRDIWKSVPDVLASIANYLKKHGWKNNHTWGREILLPKKDIFKLAPLVRGFLPGCRARMSRPMLISQWDVLGVRRINKDRLPKREILGMLVLPDGESGKAFLVYQNYKAILAYNCAHLYGLTVGLLSDQIGKAIK